MIPLRLSARRAALRVGPASIRAVLPSGERIRIESPCPTSRTSIVTGLRRRMPEELRLRRIARRQKRRARRDKAQIARSACLMITA